MAKLINLINFSFPVCGIDTSIFWENIGLLLPREKSTNKNPLTYVLSKSKITEEASRFLLLWEHSGHLLEPMWPLRLPRSNRKQANKLRGLSAALRVRGGKTRGMRRRKETDFQRHNLEIMFLRIGFFFFWKPAWYISILKLMAYTSSNMLFPANCTDN